MEKFNYDSYMRDNPLMKETSGYGNYTKPETMLEDDEPQAGENLPLGPDEELLEGSGKVAEVYSVILENVKTSIKKYGLDQDDVQELREKLAAFFK